MLTEQQLIKKIRGLCGGRDKHLVRGIGDDCAVIRQMNGHLQLITTDALVENIHFNTSWHPARKLGRKAASVNISDIAAMAGNPRYAFLSLALPAGTKDVWLDEFLFGFKEVLDEYQVLLLGGDTVRSVDVLMFSVTILGEVSEEEICYRSGARPGDAILVSGTLGDAAAGLIACKKRLEDPAGRYSSLVQRHLDPQAKVELGRLLGKSGKVHAMLDSSDGLATDLAHLCEESGVGAEIAAEGIPINDAVRELAPRGRYEPLSLAVSGGEDYQLVLTAAEKDVDALLLDCQERLAEKLTVIGRILEGKGVILVEGGRRREVSFKGFDHFR